MNPLKKTFLKRNSPDYTAGNALEKVDAAILSVNTFLNEGKTLLQDITSDIESKSQEIAIKLENTENEMMSKIAEANSTITRLEQTQKIIADSLQTVQPPPPEIDEAKIIASVLERIPAPEKIEIKEIIGEEIVDKINSLPLEEENKIDYSRLKNVPQIKGKIISGSPTVIANAVDLDSSTRTNNYAITWDSTRSRHKYTAMSVGSGTVTSVSVVSANGLAGTVATATTTPSITLSTTVTGIVKGNGTALSAAVANTDYQSPITLTTTGTSGASTFNGTILNIPNYADLDTGITQLTGDITAGPGSGSQATTLATVNANVGIFGSATQSSQVTVNAKGLITAVSNVTINPAASSITGGAALTKVNDTNITLTLGGTPTTALLAAASLTLGWTGSLAVARGGTGGTVASITLFNNITGFTASGTTGTTSTNLVFSTSPTLVTPVLGVAIGTSLALGGATIGSNALAVTGTSLFNSSVTIASASLTLSGNISAAAWTTGGIRYKNATGTLTDTTSLGTVATAYTSVFGGNTIAATNVTTFTDYSAVNFGDPIAGANVTMTNKWALSADSIKVGTSGSFNVSAAGILSTTSPIFITPTLGAATGTSLTLSNAGLPATFTNTTNSASVQALRLDGDRSAPANADEVYQSFFLSNSAGTQTEFSRITSSIVDVTAASEDGQIDFSVIQNGVMTKELRLYGTNLIPIANDGLALGQSGVAFADLFLASGGVINFNAGDITLTHSTDTLTLVGGTLLIGTPGTNDTRLLTTTGTYTCSASAMLGALSLSPTVTMGFNAAHIIYRFLPTINPTVDITGSMVILSNSFSIGTGISANNITTILGNSITPALSANYSGTITNIRSFNVSDPTIGGGFLTNNIMFCASAGNIATNTAGMVIGAMTSTGNNVSLSTGATTIPTGDWDLYCSADYPSAFVAAGTATTNDAIVLKSTRIAILSGNLIGGLAFWSDDTNLTAPGTRVSSIQAVAAATHTASVLTTDITFSSTTGTTYAELMRLKGDGKLGIGVAPTRTLSLKAGGSTTLAQVGGVIAEFFTDTSVGGAETDIYTNTTAASILATNGDKLIAQYGGNFVTVGTELTQLKVYFGGTAIWDSTGVAPTTGTTSWNVDVRIIRVSATAVRYSVTLNTTGASGFVYCTVGELAGLTLTNTNILKITGISSGVGSGVGDIIGKLGQIEWRSAA